MTNLFSQLKSLKAQIEEWKDNLPSYYEPILLPVSPEMFEYPEALELYPYAERYDYLTGKPWLSYCVDRQVSLVSR